jgi:RNA polymerase sigma-70 factor (sigma-E family)
MKASEEADYREFVVSRYDALRRVAYLLCRDWHTADDLVSITLGKLYRHWHRGKDAHNLDAYVRAMLTRTWLDELRRPWRREVATESLPEAVQPAATPTDRVALLALLGRLPPRQRAVVVLRHYCDLSVEETADLLGISVGAVKSQSARGLAALRLPAIRQYASQE